jgi:Family of unknown function (DUF5681)
MAKVRQIKTSKQVLFCYSKRGDISMKVRSKQTGRDYAVGYRRPPAASRFKPGASGNPKGRPKGTRPIGAVLHEIFHRATPVTENGKTRRVPILEVVLRRLARDAMQGDPKAIQLSFSLLARYAGSPQSTPALHDLLEEDAAILAKYLRGPETTTANPTPSSDVKGDSDET